MYTHMLAQRKLTLRFNNQGVPRWEDRALRLAWPLAVRWIRRELGVSPGIEAEDEATVWREFDFVAELLADGREYLCGERFERRGPHLRGAFASVIVPPVYGADTPLPLTRPGGDCTSPRPTPRLAARKADHAVRAPGAGYRLRDVGTFRAASTGVKSAAAVRSATVNPPSTRYPLGWSSASKRAIATRTSVRACAAFSPVMS